MCVCALAPMCVLGGRTCSVDTLAGARGRVKRRVDGLGDAASGARLGGFDPQRVLGLPARLGRHRGVLAQRVAGDGPIRGPITSGGLEKGRKSPSSGLMLYLPLMSDHQVAFQPHLAAEAACGPLSAPSAGRLGGRHRGSEGRRGLRRRPAWRHRGSEGQPGHPLSDLQGGRLGSEGTLCAAKFSLRLPRRGGALI